VTEAARALGRLLEIMARLRDPDHGCPWDREQTFATIAPYTIEEAYEVADAISRDEPRRLEDELGDLLFQVVFHARLAEEQGQFDFAAVARAIADKLERRHPHVFGGSSIGGSAEQSLAWEAFKAQEREASGDRGALAKVPLGLPALTRAGKLGKRAARVGFDWEAPAGVRAKVAEELDELDRAIGQGESRERIREELGDLLFAVVNLARHLEIDAETALREANGKFEARFRRMEALAAERRLNVSALTSEEWDRLWTEAKSPVQ
jgi:MazG family protein